MNKEKNINEMIGRINEKIKHLQQIKTKLEEYKKSKSLILNGTRGSSKPHLQTQYALSKEIDKVLDHKMCMPCCDYELCMRDNSRCYQYYEELEMMKRNVGKKKRLVKRPSGRNV